MTEFVRQKLSSYKWIDTYEFTDSIPKLASGKIQRKKLKEMAMSAGSSKEASDSEASHKSAESSIKSAEIMAKSAENANK